MLKTLELISLTQLRACKNRTSLYLAAETAKREHLPDDQIAKINHLYNATVANITALDDLLNFLGRRLPNHIE